MDPTLISILLSAIKASSKAVFSSDYGIADSTAELAINLFNKIKETSVQSAAKEEFQSKIQTIKSSEKEFKNLIVEEADLHKLSEYLLKEIGHVAEEAVTLNDPNLLDDVFSFYRKSENKLLSSTPKKHLTYQQLAEIRTELGLIHLKVAWMQTRQKVEADQQKEEHQIVSQNLRIQAEDRVRLQKRMFSVLALYVLLLILIILAATAFGPATGLIPIIGIPISVLLWSSIGSIANMLYRFYKRDAIDDVEQELRWYSARPLVGMIMGIVVYLVLQAGVIFVGFATSQGSTGQIKDEILWLFSFIGGFSDRFFEAIINRVKITATREPDEKRGLQMLLENLNENISQAGEKNELDSVTEAKPKAQTKHISETVVGKEDDNKPLRKTKRQNRRRK